MHTRPLPIVITPDLAHSSGTTVCGRRMRTGRPQAEKGMDRPRLGRNQPARHPLLRSGARRTEEASRPVRPLAAAAPAPLWTHPRATRAPRLAGDPCQVPGYPNPPGGVANLGFSWCPASVSLQVRSFALQAAGAECAIATGSSSTPEQIEARRREIRAACDRLSALGQGNCQCPPGLR